MAGIAFVAVGSVTTILLLGVSDKMSWDEMWYGRQKIDSHSIVPQARFSSLGGDEWPRFDERIDTTYLPNDELSIALLDIHSGTDSPVNRRHETEHGEIRKTVKVDDTGDRLEQLPSPASGPESIDDSENGDTGTIMTNGSDRLVYSLEENITGANHPATDTSEHTGTWCINLASLPHKEDARRFAEGLISKGINAEVAQATVKGRKYWRVRVTGFNSTGEAKEKADQIREKLGINDLWIAKSATTN